MNGGYNIIASKYVHMESPLTNICHAAPRIIIILARYGQLVVRKHF